MNYFINPNNCFHSRKKMKNTFYFRNISTVLLGNKPWHTLSLGFGPAVGAVRGNSKDKSANHALQVFTVKQG